LRSAGRDGASDGGADYVSHAGGLVTWKWSKSIREQKRKVTRTIGGDELRRLVSHLVTHGNREPCVSFQRLVARGVVLLQGMGFSFGVTNIWGPLLWELQSEEERLPLGCAIAFLHQVKLNILAVLFWEGSNCCDTLTMNASLGCVRIFPCQG
jgi:hypothetical protein